MIIGAFFLELLVVLLFENLKSPVKIPKEETIEKMLDSCGFCLLKNIKTGIWIVHPQLVRCPICDSNTCDGIMQTLDIRHIELFLSKGFLDGSWDYELIGSHETKKKTYGANEAIFDIKHLKDSLSKGIFDMK